MYRPAGCLNQKIQRRVGDFLAYRLYGCLSAILECDGSVYNFQLTTGCMVLKAKVTYISGNSTSHLHILSLAQVGVNHPFKLMSHTESFATETNVCDPNTLPRRILDQFARIPHNTAIDDKYDGVFSKILSRTKAACVLLHGQSRGPCKRCTVYPLLK